MFSLDKLVALSLDYARMAVAEDEETTPPTCLSEHPPKTSEVQARLEEEETGGREEAEVPAPHEPSGTVVVAEWDSASEPQPPLEAVVAGAAPAPTVRPEATCSSAHRSEEEEEDVSGLSKLSEVPKTSPDFLSSQFATNPKPEDETLQAEEEGDPASVLTPAPTATTATAAAGLGLTTITALASQYAASFLYVQSTPMLQKLLESGGNAVVDARKDPVVALHFQMVETSKGTLPASANKLATVTIALDSKAVGTKTAIILHLSQIKSQTLGYAALRTLLEDAAVVKVVYDVPKTLHLLHKCGVSITPENVVDLQGVLKHSQYPNAMQFTKYLDGGDSASSTYHDAVAKHLQKDPKAWSQSMLARKLLQYLAFQTRMYLECYKAVPSASGGGHQPPDSAAFGNSNQKPMQQQMKDSAPAPEIQDPLSAISIQEVSGKAKASPPHNSAASGADIAYVHSNAELDKLIQSRGVQLFKATTTPLVAVDFKLRDSSVSASASQVVAVTMTGWRAAPAPLDTIVLHLVPALDRSLVDSVLVPLLEDASIVKVMHSVHQAASVLGDYPETKLRPANCVDLQLAYEHLVDTKVRNADLQLVAKHCAVPFDTPAYKEKLMSHLDKSPLAWTRDNLASVLLQSLSHRTQVLLDCYSQLMLNESSVSSPQHLGTSKDEVLVARMTSRRWHNAVVNGGVPSIWFDSSADFAVRSLECLEELQDTTGDLQGSSDTQEQSSASALMPTLSLQCDLEPLLALLPEKYRQPILAIDGFRDKLVDICLDVGRVPHVYVGKYQRIPLVVPNRLSAALSASSSSLWEEGDDTTNLTTNNTVSAEDIAEVLESLGGPHKIGFDNRAGIDKQLHRISVMRSKTGNEVYGLTMRVGRALQHAANVLQDVLMSSRHRDKSILLLGKPGCGKTTLIRDIARSIAATGENVCIIDTSNEIGGDGLVPHQCVGWARRMMVPSLEQQASVMIECVQNHTVETLVVDEIGRKAEVLAAGTVRQRGPRIVASGHGDFRSLIRNQDLKGLVGGVQQVTVGDAAAAKTAHKAKLQAERAGAPIFDIIVELDHVDRGRCQIIWDVGGAVDAVLRGEGYAREMRKQAVDARGILSL